MFSNVLSYFWGASEPTKVEDEPCKENVEIGDEIMDFTCPRVVNQDEEDTSDWIFIENLENNKAKKKPRVPEGKSRTKPFLPSSPVNQVQPPPPTLHAVPESLPDRPLEPSPAPEPMWISEPVDDPPVTIVPSPEPIPVSEPVEDPPLRIASVPKPRRRRQKSPVTSTAIVPESVPPHSNGKWTVSDSVAAVDSSPKPLGRKSRKARSLRLGYERSRRQASILQLAMGEEDALVKFEAIEAQQKVEQRDRNKLLKQKHFKRGYMANHIMHASTPTKRSQCYSPQTRSGVSNNRSHC